MQYTVSKSEPMTYFLCVIQTEWRFKNPQELCFSVALIKQKNSSLRWGQIHS